VRGSLYLLDRLQNYGFKIKGLGTLWSLYRVQNQLHRKIVDQALRRVEPLHKLPPPFQTIIPNATRIAEATDVSPTPPPTFRHKYSAEFAGLFESLCGEIIQRSEWQQEKASASSAGKQQSVARST
jgi:chromosome partitioning protein